MQENFILFSYLTYINNPFKPLNSMHFLINNIAGLYTSSILNGNVKYIVNLKHGSIIRRTGDYVTELPKMVGEQLIFIHAAMVKDQQ